MPPREANIRHMLDEINSIGRNLTHWEEDFMIDVTEAFEARGDLTEDQLRKVQQIYDERV